MREFELTEDHVRLLRAAHVGWNDAGFGAPTVLPHMPYGNSDVLGDMAGIIGFECEYDEGDVPRFDEEQAAALRALHGETRLALQVVLAAKSFRPGLYVAADYREDWRRAY